MGDQYKFTYHGDPRVCRTKGGLTLTEASYAPNYHVASHSHPNMSFCLVINGNYVESYGKTKLECVDSAIKFQPAFEQHTDDYGHQGVRSFILEIEHAWLQKMLAAEFIDRSPSILFDPHANLLMRRLWMEAFSQDDEASTLIEGMVLELIAHSSRVLKAQMSGKHAAWLDMAKELMEEEFSSPLSLSYIAEEVGVHPVYLAASFRKRFGISVGQFLRQRRIEFACERIHTSEDPLVKIALEAGFSSQAHFTLAFKKEMSTTPAQFRKSTALSLETDN